jgi:hypothetical protein
VCSPTVCSIPVDTIVYQGGSSSEWQASKLEVDTRPTGGFVRALESAPSRRDQLFANLLQLVVYQEWEKVGIHALCSDGMASGSRQHQRGALSTAQPSTDNKDLPYESLFGNPPRPSLTSPTPFPDKLSCIYRPFNSRPFHPTRHISSSPSHRSRRRERSSRLRHKLPCPNPSPLALPT